ncbi:STAS/SEC14 domain-containing protein [Synechococcus sp. CCY9201]|uniref:STAS/SEC14 domain-containing protein n=1 Tax=Synechococcus sp. CCY9201 TaxID=174697 RepID=UPI002B217D58|nr:STAS/SEC14 domain-containing protein [Synechococcus sp. CCY9201]MEA5472849.1 STAS/SEC14 domain-containing protein [Synechococcus sp. CCY9201]
MIETIEGLPEGTLGFAFSGQISGHDYDTVLVPAMERAIEEHDRIKTLLRFGPAFEGYDLAAAWDDTLLGLRHWRGFERIAVVSDVPWLRTTIRAIGALLPCPIRNFPTEQEQEARIWLGESLGSIHLDEHNGVIQVRLIGRLEPSAYDHIDADIAALFSRVTPVKLLLDLRDFDGWSGLAALGEHLSLIREHRSAPRRVAVVGQQNWQKLVQKLLSRFTSAETRFFDVAHSAQAELWLQGNGESVREAGIRQPHDA